MESSNVIMMIYNWFSKIASVKEQQSFTKFGEITKDEHVVV